MKLLEAIKFAKKAHKDQIDDDGKPYFEHVYNVFHILKLVTTDVDIHQAGLLHDVVEDTQYTEEDLRKLFDKRVVDLVMEVTHEGQKDEYGYYFPRLKSKEGIMIKLADRLSNLSRIDNWDQKRIDHYLRKTKFWKDGSDRKVTT